jgi:hypothetical protein
MGSRTIVAGWRSAESCLLGKLTDADVEAIVL